jgi:hypothetical protein
MAMLRTYQPTNRLRLEPLEQRRLLAGDVTTNLAANGTLEIRGDDEGNEIVISAALDDEGVAIENSFLITGLNGTTIDGEPGSPGLVVEDVRNIDVRLGDGDDIVQLTDAVVRNNVNIQTGAGNDQAWIGQFEGQAAAEAIALAELPDEFLALDPPAITFGGAVLVRGKLTVGTGDDDDVVAVTDAVVRGDATINAGDGNDQVFITALADLEDGDLATGLANLTTIESDPERGLDVRGRLKVNLGDGDDSLTAFHVNARRGFFIDDPQQDTDFLLSDVDGGNRGVVITHGSNGNGPFGNLGDFFRDLFDRIFGDDDDEDNGPGGLFGGGPFGGLFGR